jgi:hypothetical protein
MYGFPPNAHKGSDLEAESAVGADHRVPVEVEFVSYRGHDLYRVTSGVIEAHAGILANLKTQRAQRRAQVNS